MLLSASKASLSITKVIKRGYTLQRLSWHAALLSTFPHHWADQVSSMTLDVHAVSKNMGHSRGVPHLSRCEHTQSASRPGGTTLAGDAGAGSQKARGGHLCSGHCSKIVRRRE